MSKSFRNSCMACFSEPKPNMEFIKYICYQPEICPTTNKKHFQTYVEFKDKFTTKKCQEYIGVLNCHLELRRGTPEEAMNYCKKINSKDGDFVEFGILPKLTKGQRNDLIDLAKRIKEDGIIEDFEILKYSKGIKDLKNKIDQEKTNHFRNVEVIVIIGKCGIGKTESVYDKEGFKNCYKLQESNNTVWFNGYEGQNVLIIDEFYGWLKYPFLLNLLDGYPLNLEIKGSCTWANYTKVYITSNDEIKSWYNEKDNISALMRRIKYVIHMVNEKNRVIREPIYLNSLKEINS